MKTVIKIIIFSWLLCGNAYASTVSEYLKLGYRLQSVNLSADGSALFYHLVIGIKKEKKVLLDLKKEKKSMIVTCIVNSKSGSTVKCFKP
jgi:hypothetical protein